MRCKATVTALLVATTVLVGMAGTATADPVPTLTVSATVAPRAGAIDVAVAGCQDDFQWAEVRLVVGAGLARRSIAVASDDETGLATLTVPTWAPDGSASVEAICTEPNLSGASDGADVKVFSFPTVPVLISGGPRTAPATVRTTVMQGGRTLRVSGAGCGGWAVVTLADGYDRVYDSSRFRFGTVAAEADASGAWSVDLPLRYSVSSFSDPVAPGPMVTFASCDGRAYEPKAVWVWGPAARPAVQALEGDPTAVYTSQCSPKNVLLLVVLADTPAGRRSSFLTRSGPGFGEVFTPVTLPAGTTSVTYLAGCFGLGGPSFLYQPLTAPVA